MTASRVLKIESSMSKGIQYATLWTAPPMLNCIHNYTHVPSSICIEDEFFLATCVDFCGNRDVMVGIPPFELFWTKANPEAIGSIQRAIATVFMMNCILMK
jgi:hypothetical protein